MEPQNGYISIKNWSIDDKPREKLLLKGRSALSDAELVAILIGSGSKNESAVSLSQRILASVNHDFNALSRLTIEQLMLFKGIGEAKAVAIAAALEIGRRRRETGLQKVAKITSSNDVFQVIRPHLSDLEHEEFWCIYLNNANKVLHKAQMSKGGITGTVVDVRLLLKQALELRAVALILAHNHPSQNLQPSAADNELTQKIKSATAAVDIRLLDHLIVTQKEYFSFADAGLL